MTDSKSDQAADDHAAVAWQAYWREVDAAAARHRQAVAQQRSDTAARGVLSAWE